MLQDKTVFGFDKFTGEYYGPEIARVCPVTRATLIYPADTTDTEPPVQQDGFARCWNGTEWTHVEDHRGTQLFDPETRESAGYMNVLGPIPDGLVTELPPLPEEGSA